MTKAQKEWQEQICAKCGLQRLKDGRDPCIPDLPGVNAACCGHGQGRGYIQFENGTVIIGDFSEMRHRDDTYVNPTTRKETFTDTCIEVTGVFEIRQVDEGFGFGDPNNGSWVKPDATKKPTAKKRRKKESR